ncbi:hypothetical protein KAH27_10370 [bacterium]|nr:hypothetical protein [bacterium]
MEKAIRKMFMSKKVLTLAEASIILDCSEIAAKYRIKKCGAVTSFNHNAKYYSLPEIIDFDENGFWIYGKAKFSRYHTLKSTIIAIVEKSESGMSAAGLADLLTYSPYTMLASMIKEHELNREKVGGCYIYFASKEESYNNQLGKRKDLNRQSDATVISDTIGIIALVEFIQHPELNLQQLSELINKQGVRITESHLHDFLEHHNLLKKTQATPL